MKADESITSAGLKIEEGAVIGSPGSAAGGTISPPAAGVLIRAYGPGDLEALFSICLATGNRGADASHLYEDPQLIGQLYAAPYARLAPDLILVAADEAGVGGYVLGVSDTEAFEDGLEQSWWPKLRPLYLDPGLSPPVWTWDLRRRYMIHHPFRTPKPVITSFPGHVHMNLLARMQRRGIGSKLFRTWLELMDRRGAEGVHAGVDRENFGALGFWRKAGFVELDLGEEGRTVWMGRPALPNA